MTVNLPPILVVDDEKNMRLSLEAVMSEEGYQYRSADSAEQALKMLEEIAKAYHDKFDRPLPVSSLVRPEQ